MSPTRTSLRQTFAGIGQTLRNRAFAVLLVAGIFSFTAQGLVFALATYFNTFFWEFPASVLAIFTLAVLLGVAAAFGIATVASRRWGKCRTAVIVTLVQPFVALSPYAGRYLGIIPVNGDPLLLPLLMGTTLVSVALGVAGAILNASMMSDVVEDAQMRTGERSEGLFFAGSFFMQKCVSGFGLFLSGAILSFVHFPAGAVPGHVPADVLERLALIYGVALILLGAVAAAVMSRFPLGGQHEHEERIAALGEAVSHAAPLPGSEAELPVR